MNEKNYSCRTSIRKVFPLLLMLVFVNVGWAQTAQTLNYTMANNFIRSNMTAANGWIYSGIGTDYSSSGSNIKFDTTGDWATLRIASAASVVKYNLKGNGLSGAYVFELSESADGNTFTTIQTITSGIGTTNTLFQATVSLSTRYLKWTYVTKANGNIGFGGVVVEAITNALPTVSNVEITGLPNTTVELTGSYDYADVENDVDASTYQWYIATDASGANASAIGGATSINYTLTNAELGYYIRLGVVPASATGTSPGVEVFSPWIGPVNAAGSPVLNAGTVSSFVDTCLNQTTVANSFTLMGNNLTGNVTVESLSGFAYSLDANGTYTSSLTIAPVDESIDTVVYVQFTPTLAQSYNGTILVSGGGATSINVSVEAEGINTPVVTTTGASSGLTTYTATVSGNLVQGCSAVSAYGIEYSTTENFANGTGTVVSANTINSGIFSVDLTGLNSFTTYYYKAFATDATGTVYGTQNSFVTNAVSAPTASAATNVGMNSFTANWEAVAGATSYELDVYEVVAGANASDLFISEYIEGSSNNKYIEIFNGTGGDVDLSDYQILLYANGASSASNTQSLSGTLTNGSVAVYRNSSANLSGTTSFPTGTAIGFNGDDAIAIFKISTGALIDIFGRIGNDPGTSWTSGAIATADQTLRRKTSVSSGITISPTGTGTSAFTTLGTEWDSYTIDTVDGLGSHTFSGGSSISYVIENQNVGNVTSYVVNGLEAGKEYFYVVRAKDANSTSANSNEVEVTTTDAVTVFEDGVWSNGVPTAALDAVILSDFTTTTDLEAKSLTISAGVFTVASGTVLTVVDAIINAAGANAFVVENNGIVLQNSVEANTALATVQVNSANLYRQDYTLWSSPVTGQNLRNFSPQTLFNRFSSYDAAIGANGDYVQEIVTTADMNTKTFVNAKGYLIRMPNNWTEYVNSSIPGTPYLGQFTGTLNNGGITLPLSLANTKLNLVGNPYPSPISISSFFAANPNINEVLYFWRKRNDASGSGFATYNAMGLVSAHPEANGLVMNNTIKPGQGFFVQSNTASTLNFNNTMRTSVQGTPFLKGASSTNELHRFWLNLSSTTEVVGQTLIGYATGATSGVDNGLDALYFNDSALALTSLIDNVEYVIQGRSLPFVDTDIVPLGFKSDVAGNFTISLSNFDGLFAEDQAIYLRDNTAGVVHNLKSSDYSFTTPAGIFNTRFEVLYNTTLGANNPALSNHNILIGVKDQIIQINAGDVTMNKIELIDVSGRVIYSQEGVNATTATLENVVLNNQMLIVRISTQENGIVTQKIIF
ncbi:lamin tail domain-containing protein [Flavobacterium sp.]|uniref:beta strand repeat-containing protein n=1 Tax=Flavobacterium sp. TaxID=239 RepID=UPI00260B237C|nr:lamin tail domain-containing protein [Flavobacterium sp.]MDD3004014.1 lamin tail domain-containing protein [Flavobacterium sp.]